MNIFVFKFTTYNQLNALNIIYHIHYYTYMYISCQKFEIHIFCFKNLNIQSKKFSI